MSLASSTLKTMSKQISNSGTPRNLDLFSGCGGLSYGLEQAGFQSVLAVDNWDDALRTFEYNHPNSKSLNADLGEVGVSEHIASLSGEVEMVVGGPPCQGFSISGKRDPNDPRNRLYQGFVDVVKILRPTIFLMENVPNLASMDGGRLLDEITADFASLGYKTSCKILLASEFGVPQNRKRLILVGVLGKKGFEIQPGAITEISKRVTTAEAISDLPEWSIEDGDGYVSPALSGYQRKIRAGSREVFNHQISSHTEKTKRTIALVPDGGNYKNLPEHLRDTRRVNIAWTRFASYAPSPTIDTGHRHHFHYEFNRIPTVRESARLQSFPDSFHFLGSKTSQYRQVGNAVPPLLAMNIGKQLLQGIG